MRTLVLLLGPLQSVLPLPNSADSTIPPARIQAAPPTAATLPEILPDTPNDPNLPSPTQPSPQPPSSPPLIVPDPLIAPGEENADTLFLRQFLAKPISAMPVPGDTQEALQEAPLRLEPNLLISPSQGGNSFWPSNVPASADPFTRGLGEITRFSTPRTLGPLHYTLRLNSAVVFDDNPTLSNGNKQSDLEMLVGPALRLQLGEARSQLQLGATYSLAASRFLENQNQGHLQQSAALDAQWSASRLRVTLRGGAESLRSGSRDLGERTAQRSHFGGITANYALGAKTSVDLGATANHFGADSGLSSDDLQAQAFLSYQMSPKLQIGAGGVSGRLEPEQGQNQSYRQGLLRTVVQPTEKITLNTSVGAEWRSYQDASPGTQSPIFSLGGNWQATARTSFTLEARRRIAPAASVAQQNFTQTAFTIGASQMITETVQASISGGYEHAGYHSTLSTLIADRKDDYYFGRAAVRWAWKRWCDVGVFYEFTRNDSSGTQGLSFQRNRLGLSLGITF